MTPQTPWQRFIARTTKGYDQAQVAKRAGISAATASRWLNKSTGSAEAVIQIARAFDDDPTLALVETGYLTLIEATRSEISANELLSRIDELDLAREIVRRLEEGEAGEAIADEAPTPGSMNVFVGGFGENVDTDQEDDIPENVEEEWAGLYAAHKKGNEPEEHTP